MPDTATPTTIQPHNHRPAAVWSAGGRDYDRISHSIADSIEHCVLRLNPQPGERILDLSTGTGWTSRLVARRGATVIGADIASGLLEAARATALAEGLAIDYQLADAEHLPFDTGAFDAVVSTCGVMFASRPEAAAAELARVCRPGGRIALTTWASDGTLFKMFEVMKRYQPAPPTPPPPSPFAWGRTERISELLGAAFELRFEPGTSYCASRAAKPCGRSSPPAMARRARSPRASTRPAGKRSTAISWPFTMPSRPPSESACPAITG